tara:strand:+ start:92 stop:967 length:876 start_codon:yes stop_codon:yes gene_type:complete
MNENDENKENIDIEIKEIPVLQDVTNTKEPEVEEVFTDDAQLVEWNKTYTNSNDFKKSTGKSVKNFNELEKKFYKRLQKREQLKKKEDKEKEKNSSLLETTPVAEIKEKPKPKKKEKTPTPEYLYTNELPDDDALDDLYIKLAVLKQKFPDINCEIDKNMSIDTLKTKYKLFMTTLETKHADSVAFSVFLLLNKGVERGAEHFFNTDMLDGLGDNVVGMKDEICEILKEMIEEGDIDTSFLTPQLRLAMVMSGVVINTIEKNSAKKKAFASVVDVEEEKTTDAPTKQSYAW